MNKLQNLIERIVEAKVASVLEEGLRRKERRKAKRERERKEGEGQIADPEYAESSPKVRDRWAVRVGRDLNRTFAPPAAGRYGKNTSRKRSRDWLKSLGTPKVSGPEGDLP